ncbi:hypothetical protein HGRIS_012812 [Hohenbuehelia grisea]|uniref:F-box domain-containing protein n=1 Tax=Hohenbuehelia grisea TaxID=104357 RepID=A0ABR3ITG5_9AGAR
MSHRRSSRLVTKSKLTHNESSDDEQPSATESKVAVQPPAKRRKVAKKKVVKKVEVAEPSTKKVAKKVEVAGSSVKKAGKKKAGKLRDLPDMPLDILFEIFGNLKPLDILRLARTTKALRDILMRRSASSIWKAACANLEGFPECPPDISIPQFVNLAFSTHCHRCLSRNASHTIWVSRIRLCRSCFEGSTVDMYNLSSYGSLPPSYHEMLFLFSRRTSWLAADCCLEEEVHEFSRAYTECPPDKVDKFLEERKQLVKERLAHARICIQWEQQVRESRSGELDGLREKRRQAIYARLAELGFGKDMDSLDHGDRSAFNNNSLVKQPRELTDRIWANISGPILALMPAFRAKRLAREKVNEIKRRRKLFQEIVKEFATSRVAEFTPSAADFYFMQEVKSFKDLIEETPVDQDVTTADFDEFKARLPELSTRWTEAATQALLDALRQRTQPADDEEPAQLDESVLSLATSLFRCKNCKDFIAYPRALEHSCMRYHRSFSFYVQVSQTTCYDDLQGKPWDMARAILTCTKEDLELLEKVVRNHDQDPATATIEELDNANRLFECTLCSNAWRCYAMGWRHSVRHVSHSPDMIRLSDEAASQAVSAFQQQQETARERGFRSWKCLLCAMTKPSIQSMKGHLRSEHGVQDPAEEQHYVYSIDNPCLHDLKASLPRDDNGLAGSALSDDDDDTMFPSFMYSFGMGGSFFSGGFDLYDSEDYSEDDGW